MRRTSMFAALVLVGCGSRGDAPSIGARPDPVTSAPKLRVRVIAAKREATTGTRVFPGVLVPWEKARLGARVAGELTSIAVDRGDRVRKGQLLATIGIPGLPQEVQRARAQKRAVAADLALLEDERRRMDAVVKSGPKGVVADAERAALDARVDGARARVAVASADQGRGGALLADTRIVAPFDGTVLARLADRGTALPAGGLVVDVADVRTLRMTIDVPERDAASVKVGLPVTVVVPAQADRTAKAKVARFAPALDEATRTLRVEVDVPNDDGFLLAGVAARASVDLGSRGEVWVVPAEVVVQEGAESVVFVVEGGFAHRRRIAVAHDRGPVVEISQGIGEGDAVVLGGRGLVREGTPCEVAR